MTSKERHVARYFRRVQKRLDKKIIRSNSIGSISTVHTFGKMMKYGKDCCKGVRWKRSTQKFETHLFSGSAKRARKVINGTYVPSKYMSFTINERGKTRNIDAPTIQDRQIHKVYTKEVLLPLYQPMMIYNNGASIEGKGIEFSKRLLRNDLREHFKKYGMNGNIILIDFHKFFPSASHKVIMKMHDELIFNDKLKRLGNIVLGANNSTGIGVPLGVEQSQAEMIAYPSELDAFISCQLMLSNGHYMDDYYVLVTPDVDAQDVLNKIIRISNNLGLEINLTKTKIVKFGKPFKYCKAKFIVEDNGGICYHCNRDSIKRARGKIRSFHKMVSNDSMPYENLRESMNSIFAYIDNFNDHNRELKLVRLFYNIYGFNPMYKINFDRAELQKYKDKIGEQ